MYLLVFQLSVNKYFDTYLTLFSLRNIFAAPINFSTYIRQNCFELHMLTYYISINIYICDFYREFIKYVLT